MIYLNHAATTYPKPESVQAGVMQAIAELPQSQYRSVAGESPGEDIMKKCRENLALLFGIKESQRIFFTSGSTQALNMAILGLFRDGESRRRKIVITAAEHNAVLRTVCDGLQKELADGVCELSVIPCDKSGYVDMEKLREAVTEDTALVVVNHSSNVTGAVQRVEEIGKLASEKGALFLVDASQSAGALPIDVEKMHIDMLAFTAHKGLYGIEGSGGLYVRSGIRLRPVCFGGTGTDSRVMIPEEPFYEVGTANIPGIAGLNAGVEFVLKTGIPQIMEKEHRLMKRLYEGMKAMRGVTVFADRCPGGTALSFLIDNLSPADTGYILSGSYKILVRTGLHCAPLIHQYLGTEKLGTVRVSISYLTTEEEIEAFLQAAGELAAAVTGGEEA